METKYGVMLRVEGDRAIVRLDAEDGGCGGGRSCPLKNLCHSRDAGQAELAIPVDPAAAPRIGDRVRVEYRAANRAVAALALFLPALAGLSAGGVIADAGWHGSDAVFLAGCGGGFSLGIFCTFLLSRFAATLRPVATIRLSGEKREDSETCCHTGVG